MAERVIQNLEALNGFASEILSILPQKTTAHTLVLSGDLGAGKTTFTQILAKNLGVTEHVTSPTFVIMRSYETTDENIKKLIHIDAYRVEDEKEAEVLALAELQKEAGTLIVIEWPEKIKSYIPNDSLKIHFEIKENDSRRVLYD